jgi:hypothetical protein
MIRSYMKVTGITTNTNCVTIHHGIGMLGFWTALRFFSSRKHSIIFFFSGRLLAGIGALHSEAFLVEKRTKSPGVREWGLMSFTLYYYILTLFQLSSARTCDALNGVFGLSLKEEQGCCFCKERPGYTIAQRYYCQINSCSKIAIL